MEFMKWMKLIGLRLIEFDLFVGYGPGRALCAGSIPFIDSLIIHQLTSAPFAFTNQQ